MATKKTPGRKPATTPGKAPGKPARAAPKGKAALPATEEDEAKPERRSRENTKQARMIEMLKAAEGATVEEMAKAFKWQPHTVRGAIYGALKKKGLAVTSEKVTERGRVFRITS